MFGVDGFIYISGCHRKYEAYCRKLVADRKCFLYDRGTILYPNQNDFTSHCMAHICDARLHYY